MCLIFIQVWSPLPLYSNHTPQKSRDPPVRSYYSYSDHVIMSLENDAISDSSLDSESMEESGRALAFFDQLIQQENTAYDSESQNTQKNNNVGGVCFLRVWEAKGKELSIQYKVMHYVDGFAIGTQQNIIIMDVWFTCIVEYNHG